MFFYKCINVTNVMNDNKDPIEFTEEESMFLKVKDNRKDPIALSRMILESLGSIVKCDKALYIYDGSIYNLLDVNDLKSEIQSFLVKYAATSAWKDRSSILEAISTYKEIKTIDSMNDYEDLMCLNNGILNLKTKEIIPHSPDYYFSTKINIDYNPDKKDCPNFIHYIEDTFNGNKNSIQNVIMLGGYLLDTSTKANKMFILSGEGGSGKSTLIDTFSMFFDKSQVTGLSLEVLSNETSFAREKLIKSRVNLCAEAKKGYLDSEEIKKIITGDLIEVDRKYQLGFSFRPRTKIIVAANGLMSFKDTSDGIFRRLYIIDFPNQYRSAEEIKYIKHAELKGFKVYDPNLFEKIKAEKDAIFNLFLSGLDMLREKDYLFVISKEISESMNEFKRDGDTPREFLESNYEIDLNSELNSNDIYEHYLAWYNDNIQRGGIIKYSKASMGKKIKEVFGFKEVNKKRIYNHDNNRTEETTVYPLKMICDDEFFDSIPKSDEVNKLINK